MYSLTNHHTFHCCSQGHNESIAEYIAKLRHLATSCDFGIFLEQALHDHLVFGICSESTQRGLLTEFDIKLSKVVELQLSLEAPQQCSQALKNPDSSSLQVYKLTRINLTRHLRWMLKEKRHATIVGTPTTHLLPAIFAKPNVVSVAKSCHAKIVSV